MHGRVVKAEKSEQKWSDLDILILTRVEEEDEMCLFACSEDLKLTLLLKDRESKSLDQKSYFKFISAPSKTSSQDSKQDKELNDTKLYLLCANEFRFH